MLAAGSPEAEKVVAGAAAWVPASYPQKQGAVSAAVPAGRHSPVDLLGAGARFPWWPSWRSLAATACWSQSPLRATCTLAKPMLLRQRPGTTLGLPHRWPPGSASCPPGSRGSWQAWPSGRWWSCPGGGCHWHHGVMAPWARALPGAGWKVLGSRPVLEAAAHIWQTAAERPRSGSCRRCRYPAGTALPCPARQWD